MTDRTAEPLVLRSMMHALVRTEPNIPHQREWILVQARTLDAAFKAAKEYHGVQQVYEVCWDPGYIT